MSDIMDVLEIICQPMKSKLTPRKRRVKQSISFNVPTIASQVATSGKLYWENHLKEYLGKIWSLALQTTMEQLLIGAWNQYDYAELLDFLAWTGSCERITLLPEHAQPQTCSRVSDLYEAYFEGTSVEELFGQYIHPRSKLNHECYANVSHSPKAVEQDIELILNADISDKVWTQETLRDFRKKALQVVFSYVTHYDTLDQRAAVFRRLEKALEAERAKQTDTEWWSLHHVLCGMCSGSNEYHVPLWFNPSSHFSYLIVGKYGMESLIQTYQAAVRSKPHIA